MKIAVLLYGRIKKFKDHYSNLMESLGENQLDFFYSSDAESLELISEFTELYKPIAICNNPILETIQSQLYKYQNPPSPDHGIVNVDNMTRHFINKGRVFKLLENYIEKEGIKYDLVFSTRLDIFYNEQLNFNSIKENTIYIPDGRDYADLAVNDNFAHGTFETMKKYMNLYDNIIGFLDKHAFLHPESLHFWNIRHHGINIIRYPLCYEIIR